MSATTCINVIAGAGEVVPLEIPLELACSLILTRGGQHAYTMEDVLAASSALKKFRDVQLVCDPLDPLPTEQPPKMEPVLTTEAADLDLCVLCYEPKTAQSVQDVLSSLGAGAERLSMVVALASEAVTLAQHGTGCRVFQKALDVGSLEERLLLAAAMPETKIVELCVDVNANHVMQKFIEVLPSEYTEFIIEQIAAPFTNTVARLSVHCYGCRVIQRVLSRCELGQKTRVLDAICGAVGELVCDQFGNYVIQHSLDFGREQDREKIIAALAARDLQMLSCNKYASNVIEKAARLSQTNAAAGLLVEGLGRLSDEQLLEIMKDRYGNYVARAFLELSSEKFAGLVRVRELVREHATTLKKFTYGWHLVEKLRSKVTRGL